MYFLFVCVCAYTQEAKCDQRMPFSNFIVQILKILFSEICGFPKYIIKAFYLLSQIQHKKRQPHKELDFTHEKKTSSK